jgi:hypothetical protein
MAIAECGLKKKTKKIRNPKSAIRNNGADALCNPPASGPQACFYPEKRIEKVKMGKGKKILTIS